MRRFSQGQNGDIGGLEWRITKGTKAPDDLVLEFRSAEWVKVKMSAGFLMADFFFENEDVLYPPGRGYRGGRMYLDYCKGAVLIGWSGAHEQLEAERERKRAA